MFDRTCVISTMQDLGYTSQADFLSRHFDNYLDILICEYCRWLYDNAPPKSKSSVNALVQQIMKWDMGDSCKPPWYQLQQGQRQQLLLSIERGLEAKFGTQGLQLMPQISQISDLERLTTIQQAIRTVNTLDELRQLL
ncbi:hypothetical protein [Iningainema tapete]|nr:hypothetical protein [Iningainema tapete]